MTTALPSLSSREAIADALHRAVLAFDTADSALLESSLVPDAVFDLDGYLMNGLDEISRQCYDKISKLDTTHFVSNVRINVVDGAPVASMTASVLSQHYRPGTGKVPGAEYYMAGSLYSIDVVRDDSEGLWKIKRWNMKIIWTMGEASVIE
ncbi:hypothetical protein ASPWEDRAFT_117101 [Aspergillus wentii DTO 134E9]|uniref:SnoaL-like domain-containing protein n=1 Tax=Aspergillus wentii DTO 134E9 TaxID=1073089 RepID=A0A1L9RBE6_ASPWE|nr:uncharacterized protein ASPWEDRAFT_117101 [Aspergillus wentii DTO 134E9]KAI9934823.1 hypothetical protein MW887_000440 [Aspergillus wentii]OJJ32256.1 hypothetical protein ASPWEDRAFT_117101 [Aspergillus wentii DTO 134E9]